MTLLALPQPDWLAHALTVSGPAGSVAAFRRAAAGAGAIPWVYDLDRMQDDWFNQLLAPGHDISVQGARMLAQTYRDLVGAHHGRVVAAVGRSQACPLDLHALVPVPDELLRLGPDEPASRAWLWRHWGTTRPLRRVVLRPGSTDRRRSRAARVGYEFHCADWSPWPALRALRARWPDIVFDLRPDYGPPPGTAVLR